MIVQTDNRLDVIEALLKFYLKDKSLYCNNCDTAYIEGQACCDDPQIGTNEDHIRALVIENELRKSNLKKETGSGETGLRQSFSIPPRLYHLLNEYFRRQTEKRNLPKEEGKFPKDNHELYGLMRKFKGLCAVNKV